MISPQLGQRKFVASPPGEIVRLQDVQVGIERLNLSLTATPQARRDIYFTLLYVLAFKVLKDILLFTALGDEIVVAKTDIVVVGGGPCGSFSALTAARRGAAVSVFEEHREIGVPNHCAGHLSVKGLEQLGLSLPHEIIENEIRGAVFYSPSGRKITVKRRFPVTTVVNRELFDKHLSYLAKKSGVQYFLESKVRSLLFSSGFVTGVSVKKGHTEKRVASNLVIDAEGFSSTLLKKIGLQTLRGSMVVKAVQAEVDRIDNVENDLVEVYLGRKYAPGFFAWVIPKKDASAKIGLATQVGSPQECLARFMKTHPIASKKLCKSKITRLVFHPISLGGPIPKTYSDGLLVVGDAASQVKPTTGGGVIVGMLCSKIAGDVAYNAVTNSDVSEHFLAQYQARWKELLGFDFSVMLRLRKMLNHLSDKKMEKLIQLCNTLGVDSALETFEDLDFQGRLLLPAISHPNLLIVLLYFMISCL